LELEEVVSVLLAEHLAVLQHVSILLLQFGNTLAYLFYFPPVFLILPLQFDQSLLKLPFSLLQPFFFSFFFFIVGLKDLVLATILI
jgi:hypothetical protein